MKKVFAGEGLLRVEIQWAQGWKETAGKTELPELLPENVCFWDMAGNFMPNLC